MFTALPAPTYALVTLKSGHTVHGEFAARSFAADTPAERDIYLERTFRIEGDIWVPVAYSRGILIAGGEVSRVEFFSLDEPVGAEVAAPAAPTPPSHRVARGATEH